MPNPARVERTHLRRANSKHFLLDDGRAQVEIYLHPVHYLDDAGVWQDIDTTLRVSGDHVRSTNRRAPVRLSRYADGAATIDDRKGRSISYRPVGPAHVKGTHAKNVLTHTDAWPEADLQWIMSPSGLVSEMTLKSSSAPATYAFRIDADQLDLRTGDDGIIRAWADQFLAFELARPVVFDADGIFGSATLTMRDEIGGRYLDLVLDPTWLADPARKWPVTVQG